MSSEFGVGETDEMNSARNVQSSEECVHIGLPRRIAREDFFLIRTSHFSFHIILSIVYEWV